MFAKRGLCCGAFVVLCVTLAPVSAQDDQRVFLIGNSLTMDALPVLLGQGVQWHIDCGKNLQYIHDHPQKPCVKSSYLWPIALAEVEYDVLCVQPHFGTRLDQDVAVISEWMRMQPQARLVIHTGW